MSNGSTRGSVPGDSAQTTIEALGENPLALLAGGVALGVLVGILLPRVSREREVLQPFGRKLADGASAAVAAARDAGRAEVEAILPNRDAAKERVSQLLDSVLEAAKGAAARA